MKFRLSLAANGISVPQRRYALAGMFLIIPYAPARTHVPPEEISRSAAADLASLAE